MKLSAWRKTISGKLTLIYTIMFIVVLVLLNTAAFFGLRYYIFTNVRTNLINTLKFVTDRVYKGFNDQPELLKDISRSEQSIYFRILSPDSQVLLEDNLLKNLDVDVPIKNGINHFSVNGRSFIYASQFLIIQGDFKGYIQAVREVTSEYRFLRWLLLVMVITSILGSIGAIIAGYLVTRKMLNPINLINNTVRNITSSDLSKRLEIKGPEDELTRLADTFNSMVARLEESFKKQQQFVSNASHELRTPISIIQGYAKMLQRWGKEDEDVRDEAIAAIGQETENMKSLVENLLFLARGDSDKIELQQSCFKADELVEDILRETEIITEDINIQRQASDRCWLNADKELIKQMLRIFIDNGIKYTPTGGSISVGVKDTGDMVKFIVKDTGIGISEEDLPHIFDRFYIADKARSRKGTGLGLAIARWIIEQHQGKVDVNSNIGEGTTINVYIPKDND
ncbi:MAG: sensor histidine kinase [Halothermotrichaceae bacterium]